ncbi:MAG: beta-ketoacyl-ACP synthase II [Candidatus Cryptobacteroides sp.]
MTERRVAVTGLGIISPSGNDVKTFWNNISQGHNGIGRITRFRTGELAASVAGEVKDFNPADYGLEPGFTRKQDLFSIYAAAAAQQAMEQSGLDASEGGNIDPFRLGVYVGSGIGGFPSTFKEIEKMLANGPRWVSPLYVPTMIPNMAAANIAMRHHAYGPCLSLGLACATGTNSIGEAFREIKHGYADAIIAGGTESPLIPMAIAGFANARTLSPSDNPDYASLPFNADREGFVIAEGAGILVLEDMEHAKARGAEILGEICGYGNTCDAFHMTAPRPDGRTQGEAIRLALSEAGFDSTRDKLYINAHGTGTRINDVCETKAFKYALGEEVAHKVHISSTKSMTGHALGAAGGFEAIAALLALRDGIIPPTINLKNQDPECDLDYTACTAVKDDINIAASDSLGFGGHNACVAFRRV